MNKGKGTNYARNHRKQCPQDERVGLAPVLIQLGLFSPVGFGDPVEGDVDNSVGQVATQRTNVDAVEDNAASEREHSQSAVGVEGAAYIPFTGCGAAQAVG